MSLNSTENALVSLVLAQRNPPLWRSLQGEDLLELPLDIRNDIRREIGYALASFGFDDYEPNDLGLELERLIDLLGPRDGE